MPRRVEKGLVPKKGRLSVLRVLACLSAAGCLIAACVDYPGRLSHLVPREVLTSNLLAYNTIWGTCAVAVYSIDPEFKSRIDKNNNAVNFINNLNASEKYENDGIKYKNWKETPVITNLYDMSFLFSVVARSISCFDSLPRLRGKFEANSFEDGGAYFSTSQYDDVAILIPRDGILIVAGH